MAWCGCGDELYKCEDCREIYCERCEGVDHDQMHAESEKRQYQDRLDDLNEEFGRRW